MINTITKPKRRWFEKQTLAFILFPAVVWVWGVSLHDTSVWPDFSRILSMLLRSLLGGSLYTVLPEEGQGFQRVAFAAFHGLWLGSFLVLTNPTIDSTQATIFFTVSCFTYGACMYIWPKPASPSSRTEAFSLPQAPVILASGWFGALALFWLAPDVRAGIAWAVICLWLAPTQAQPMTSAKRIFGALASLVMMVLFLAI